MKKTDIEHIESLTVQDVLNAILTDNSYQTLIRHTPPKGSLFTYLWARTRVQVGFAQMLGTYHARVEKDFGHLDPIDLHKMWSHLDALALNAAQILSKRFAKELKGVRHAA